MIGHIKDIETFTSIDFGEVRATIIDGEIAFVASDIATALGYKKPDDAIRRHCRKSIVVDTDLKSVNRYGTSYVRTIPIRFIFEPDLYVLIFSSHLPSAVRFTDWVTEEVLPKLRKNKFAVIDTDFTREDVNNLLSVAAFLTERCKENEHFAEVGRYLSKADEEGNVTITELAKAISDDVSGAGPNLFRGWLVTKRYICEKDGSYIPYQWTINNKLLTYELDPDIGHPVIKITPRGQDQIIREFHADRIAREKYYSLEKFSVENGYTVDRDGTIRDKDGFMILKEAYPGALEDAKNAMKIGSKTNMKRKHK